jgi:hypothetical protein
LINECKINKSITYYYNLIKYNQRISIKKDNDYITNDNIKESPNIYKKKHKELREREKVYIDVLRISVVQIK